MTKKEKDGLIKSLLNEKIEDIIRGNHPYLLYGKEDFHMIKMYVECGGDARILNDAILDISCYYGDYDYTKKLIKEYKCDYSTNDCLFYLVQGYIAKIEDVEPSSYIKIAKYLFELGANIDDWDDEEYLFILKNMVTS